MPFTALSDETDEALTNVRDVELHDVSASDTSYFDLLQILWAAGEDFAIVEQDIVPRPATLASFERCPRAWCAAPYPYLGSPGYTGLGCVRFRGSLTRALPDLMEDVALHDYPGHSPRHWCTLDAAIQRELWKRGRQVCAGHPTVGHLHSVPTHGCVVA